jgi:hypothetical protein
MAKSPEPVVLELASLPRELMGAFLILGLDKTADKAAIEEHWADRLKWARRQLIKVPLEDVNWAREELGDAGRRVKADASSLNSDTSDGVLRGLARRFGLHGGQATRAWQPLDNQKDLAEYTPAADTPDRRAVCEAIVVPAPPDDLPAAAALLAQLAEQPLDPWALELPQA